MSQRKLLIFDFDGVIVDGMPEYWWSARQSVIQLLDKPLAAKELPKKIPTAFQTLRPWVHKGWEMVLIAAELLRPDSTLYQKGALAFARNYSSNCKEALEKWGWNAEQLQVTLDQVRSNALQDHRNSWLKLHHPFPAVLERLKRLHEEEIDFSVLTTKGASFTAEILHSLHLKPNNLYGHESGSKSKVLLEISKSQTIHGFIEDRRATLEMVLSYPELKSIPCYLASWGYLKPNDSKNLPHQIRLIEPKDITAPLARRS